MAPSSYHTTHKDSDENMSPRTPSVFSFLDYDGDRNSPHFRANFPISEKVSRLRKNRHAVLFLPQ